MIPLQWKISKSDRCGIGVPPMGRRGLVEGCYGVSTDLEQWVCGIRGGGSTLGGSGAQVLCFLQIRRVTIIHLISLITTTGEDRYLSMKRLSESYIYLI